MMDFLSRFFLSAALLLSLKAHAQFSGKILFPEGYPEKKNAVVYVEAKGLKVSAKKVAVINQKDMQFLPFLTVTTLGSKVIFENDDPHLHTVKAETGPLKAMNQVMTPVKRSYERVLNNLGVSEILCDIHSQMRAFVVVVPNDLYAITDDEGAFRLPGELPAPPFEIKVWHEILPPASVAIESVEDIKKAKAISLSTWDVAR